MASVKKQSPKLSKRLAAKAQQEQRLADALVHAVRPVIARAFEIALQHIRVTDLESYVKTCFRENDLDAWRMSEDGAHARGVTEGAAFQLSDTLTRFAKTRFTAELRRRAL